MGEVDQGVTPSGSGLSPSVEPVPVSPAGAASIPNADLFGEPEVIRPKPRKLDLRTEFLKERYGLPEDWVWHSFEGIGSECTHALYKGGVYLHAKQRGKYKGRTDYRRPEPGTERDVVFSEDDFQRWLPAWEARTGRCSECRGEGQKWTGWHHERGNSYVDCPRCSATGIAPASAIEARRAETGTGSVEDESAAPKADAQGGAA